MSGIDKTKNKKINKRINKTKKDIHGRDIKFDKLDNTANLFPVIAREGMSNVYRVAVVLKDDIDPVLLQKALERVLPHFDVFKARMRRGIFWYYFETNRNPAPRVKEESAYPCMYINPYENNEYQFRMTYYKRRINLEVFHALTDGNGALAFLKEVTYQYLRYRHPELADNINDSLMPETSLDYEDSYVKNYRHSAGRAYKTEKAVLVRGDKLFANELGVIHGYISLPDIKRAAKSHGTTINQYLIGTYVWSIYHEYMRETVSAKPVSVCVPVNLRPYFGSDTTKNFFVIVSAVFKPVKNCYTYDEVLAETAGSLKEQIERDNLERLFSYNVSNEKNMVLRAVPLFIKNIAMKHIYRESARANTSTVTNLGVIQTAEPYREYIDGFCAMLSMSQGQNIKGAVCSYGDTLVFTFSSCLRDTGIQKAFFRKLSEEGVALSIETNGVYYE